MTGHVFVVRGDIKLLECDAWMLPTDARFQISAAWTDAVGLDEPGKLDVTPWSTGERSRPHPTQQHPNLWLAETAPVTGLFSSEALRDFHMSGVDSFVRAVSSSLPASSDGNPLRLALPLAGTGEGGLSGQRGVMLKSWFAHLHELSSDLGVDLVTVCWTAKDYAAAQRARREVFTRDRGTDIDLSYWDFGSRSGLLRDHARRLAKLCSAGHLALYLGAGVSAGAGLPTWIDLLRSLDDRLGEQKLGLSEGEELAGSFDLRDLAALLERRFDKAFETEQSFTAAVAEQLDMPRHSLQHSLIASMPANEVITTNFDRLFELAATAGGRPLSVLPGSPVEESNRWLLKIHGSVDALETMVFTRSGYLAAPRQWGALFGLVQAMLLTRHMLFIGYSLTDEDFNEVVNEVRLALPSTVHPAPLGTAITLFDDPVMAELWESDVEVVAVCDGSTDGANSVAHAARELERLLDLIGFLAADTAAFVLDESYSDMLDAEERELRDLLTQVADGIPLEATGPGWERLRALMVQLGLDQPPL